MVNTKLFAYAWQAGSKGLKELKEALKNEGVNLVIIKHKNSKFRSTKDKTILNWGCSTQNFLKGFDNKNIGRVLNMPDVLEEVTNKLSFFEALESLKEMGVESPRIPDWTKDKEVVQNWLDEGHEVCVRKILTGHSAEGLSIIQRKVGGVDIPDAPLYTKYVKKQHEFRVHFANGKIIDVQRKALRNDFDKDEANWQIRNHNNGFVYVREGFVTPPDVTTQINKMLQVMNLDFGAADVLYNEASKKAYLLEINTAPGLQGTTAVNYAKAIKELINE